MEGCPKDPALEEAPIMSWAKLVADFVNQKILPALNERVSLCLYMPCIS